ncbi:MAG TPA: malectin [Verrucomicrobiae bacterium]|nr:malectin [Verrucomicrobiae bacterium]
MKISFKFHYAFLLVAVSVFIAGCESKEKVASSNPPPATMSPPAVAASQPVAPATNVPPVEKTVVRIKAGASSPVTDSQGNVWLADQGFSGGDTIERPDLTITNTTEPEIYRSEHYSMDSFSWPLANGKYLVKLHFCETYEGITDKGQRVFSFNVQGHEFKDFDVWAKAGGPLTAYVETVPVEITDGKLLITFTSNIENPQINGIEIIPQP